MKKLTKWDYFKAITIMILFGVIVYCAFILNVKSEDFATRLTGDTKTQTLLLIMVIATMINFCFITNFKLKERFVLIQSLYDTAVVMSLTSMYILITNIDFQTVIFFGLTVLFVIALVVLRIIVLKKEFVIYSEYKHNPDRYIRLDNTESPLKKDYNYAQMELDKARNKSAFYDKKTVNAGDYFENARSKKGINTATNQSFFTPHNNNYDRAFMEGQDNTNNAGVAFDFNPDPRNAKSAGRSFKDNMQRNTTDVDKLNKEFEKKYHSKNGL